MMIALSRACSARLHPLPTAVMTTIAMAFSSAMHCEQVWLHSKTGPRILPLPFLLPLLLHVVQLVMMMKVEVH